MQIPEIWSAALGELELQMTRSVFNTWLKDAELVSAENDVLRIAVQSEYARDWLQTRLYQTVQRAVSGVAGRSLTLEFMACEQLDSAENEFDDAAHDDNASHAPPCPGFPDAQQNWTKTPDFYFDIVLPNSTPTMFKTVGAVIRNTLGKRDKRGNSAEWWQAVSYTKLSAATGVSSRSALALAIWQARQQGYIKRRKRGNTFDYALRWHDEAIDMPEENRPK